MSQETATRYPLVLVPVTLAYMLMTSSVLPKRDMNQPPVGRLPLLQLFLLGFGPRLPQALTRLSAQLRAGAKRIQELGVKAELEIFDTGHLWFARA